jgi:hypothetical protein
VRTSGAPGISAADALHTCTPLRSALTGVANLEETYTQSLRILEQSNSTSAPRNVNDYLRTAELSCAVILGYARMQHSGRSGSHSGLSGPSAAKTAPSRTFRLGRDLRSRFGPTGMGGRWVQIPLSRLLAKDRAQRTTPISNCRFRHPDPQCRAARRIIDRNPSPEFQDSDRYTVCPKDPKELAS